MAASSNSRCCCCARAVSWPSDEIALGADWPSVERFANAEVELVRLIGNDEAKPRWNEGDFFGDLFGAGRDGSAGGAGSR